MNPYRPKTEEITPTHMVEPMQRPIQVINSRKRPNHRDESGISPKKLRFAPETMLQQLPYQQYQLESEFDNIPRNYLKNISYNLI